MTPKVLVFDIETSLMKVWSFGLWKQNISIDQIIDHPHLLCWAAKWLEEDEIYSDMLPNYTRNYKRNKKDDIRIVTKLHKLMDEADILIGHNGDRFDIPYMNTFFIKHGLPPISPSKSIDTLKIARQYFRFPSNKLDYLGMYLELGRKKEHEGIGLWIGCQTGCEDSWKRMLEYNIQDVELLEKIYIELRPYMKNHPNMSMYRIDSDSRMCPVCESKDVHRKGYYHSNAGKYIRFKCNDCRHNFRGVKNLGKSIQRGAL